MSYEYNSLGIKPSDMANYKMHRPSLYGSSTTAAPVRRRAKQKTYLTGIKALSMPDLRRLCRAKDAEAIAEYERRIGLGPWEVKA